MFRGFDKCQGCHRVRSADGGTELYHQGRREDDSLTVLADWWDPAEAVNEIGESKNNKEGDKGANKSIDKDVLDVFEEFLFFEVVATREYHGWEECEEEYLLVELELTEVMCEVDDDTEEQAYENAGAGLMDVVELSYDIGTWWCSKAVPINE